MNYIEDNEEFGRIMKGTDLEGIFDTSRDEFPELLRTAGSPMDKPHNAEGLAPLEGGNEELRFEGDSCQRPSSLFPFVLAIVLRVI